MCQCCFSTYPLLKRIEPAEPPELQSYLRSINLLNKMIVLQNFINGDFVDTKNVNEDNVIERYTLLFSSLRELFKVFQHKPRDRSSVCSPPKLHVRWCSGGLMSGWYNCPAMQCWINIPRMPSRPPCPPSPPGLRWVTRPGPSSSSRSQTSSTGTWSPWPGPSPWTRGSPSTLPGRSTYQELHTTSERLGTRGEETRCSWLIHCV